MGGFLMTHHKKGPFMGRYLMTYHKRGPVYGEISYDNRKTQKRIRKDFWW